MGSTSSALVSKKKKTRKYQASNKFFYKKQVHFNWFI